MMPIRLELALLMLSQAWALKYQARDLASRALAKVRK